MTNPDKLREYFVHDLKWGWGYQSQTVFSFLENAAAKAAGGIVLDAGAGHQRYKPFFSDSIYVAQEHPIAGQNNKGITDYDILADVRRIPLRSNSVDLILSTSSLEHMEYPEAFFTEAYRVLTSGGGLYINVPFVYKEHEIPYDFQRPTRYGLRRYYEHAGFLGVTVRPTSSSISTAMFFLGEAIREDGNRLGSTLQAKTIRKTSRIAAYLMRSVLQVLDKGPHEDTSFPVGWVATGYKQGERGQRPTYRTTREFIEDNADCDSHTCLRDGRILPTGETTCSR